MTLPVRVMVQDAWTEVPLLLTPDTSFAQLKQAALAAAKVMRPASEYELKRNGASVLDETRTLLEAMVPANAPFIVLPVRRRPVK